MAQVFNVPQWAVTPIEAVVTDIAPRPLSPRMRTTRKNTDGLRD